MLSHILRPEGSNPGGALSLEFCPVIGLYSFPAITDQIISAVPGFHPGFQFWKIEVIQHKLSYDCTQEDTDQGPVYNILIKGVVKGDSAALKAQFFLMSKVRSFIVAVKDNNKLTRLAGNMAQDLVFSYKNIIGDDMGSLRSYAFQFKGTLTEDPPIYTA